ncbi:hypothetical protein ACFQ3L_01860 [Lacticaseibacillus jixianensis]|uniref:Carboxypeptidase regulatory-like domain-containing protein n=1 Tax=Lacticaseibacillus jixianensis TaxID=2486012 RepID=A0ABW4B5N2_9LACO|nr:hypothetical protein [Lacticaseibacillus jixianensis]
MKKSLRLVLAVLTGVLLIVGLSGCKSNDLSLSLTKSTVTSDDSGNATVKGTVKGDGVLYVDGQKAVTQPAKSGKFNVDFMVGEAFKKHVVNVKYENKQAKKSVTKKLTVNANARAIKLHKQEQKKTDEINSTWDKLKDNN